VTTFYMDLLGDTLRAIESHELMFNVSNPSSTRSALVDINATQILIRQATPTTLLPPRKHVFSHDWQACFVQHDFRLCDK